MFVVVMLVVVMLMVMLVVVMLVVVATVWADVARAIGVVLCDAKEGVLVTSRLHNRDAPHPRGASGAAWVRCSVERTRIGLDRPHVGSHLQRH